MPKVSIDGEIARTVHTIAKIGRGQRPAGTDIRSPEAFFSVTLGKLATTLLGKVGVGYDQAKKIGSIIGDKATDGIKGAATDAFVSGIAGSLGIHLSSGGSQIGGAIGGLTGLPGGSIIGSVLGGIVGNLFAPKARPGGVTIGNVDGQAGQTGTSGSDAKLIAQSTALGSSVSQGLDKVVEQLGGTLGDFSVSIGKYKDSYRVNTGGRALGGVKGSGTTDFGDDQQGAVAYAIGLAVSQGAVKGLSAAVSKALASSTDIDAALTTALKVQSLETAIGGVTAQIGKLFSDAAKTAADNVALAKKYGLDLLATQKYNADQRSALIASTLKSRVGSLQDLLDSLSSGDLYEGDAAGRHKALLTQIKGAQADAEAGKDGAADLLTQLENRLISTSKDAYGTAGLEYVTDRDNAMAGVQRVINIKADRIAKASGDQANTTAAVQAGNGLASETNDLLAINNAKLSTIADLLGSSGAAGGTINLASTAISAKLT